MKDQKIFTLDIETARDPNIGNYISLYEDGIMSEWENSVMQFEKDKSSGKTKKGARTPSQPKLKSERPGLHWLTGTVCCWGMVDIHDCDKSRWVMAGKDEKELLEELAVQCSKCSVIVTFNGLKFDIPFLIHRAGILGVDSLIKELPKSDKWGHGKRHIDIYDKFGAHWGLNACLEEYAIAYGLYETYVPHTWEEVQECYDNDMWQPVHDFCLGDNLVLANITQILWDAVA